MMNKNKQICIFNYWFGAAYGGILTAYALQNVLQQLGLTITKSKENYFGIKCSNTKTDTTAKELWNGLKV